MTINPEQACRLYGAHQINEPPATVEQVLRNQGYDQVPWNEEYNPRNDTVIAVRWIAFLVLCAAVLMGASYLLGTS